LQIEDLDDAFFPENVVVPADSFLESKPAENLTKRLERDVLIGSPGQYLCE